jgi:hypothetical protein
MVARRFVAAIVTLGAFGALPLACTSQTVDAVEIKRRLDGGGDPDAGALPDAEPPPPDSGNQPDSDGDGVPDSVDGCKDDPSKTVPGTCGCGLPDPPLPDGEPSCLDLDDVLVHRYTFIGPSGSAAVVDSQSGRDGEVVGTALAGNGTLALAGGTSDQYVNLPNGILSSLTSATIETWVQWNGGAEWQRIFDFGSNDAPDEDQQGFGATYLFLTARTKPDDDLRFQTGKLRVSFKGPDTEDRELFAEASIALPSGGVVPTHLAVVVDAELKMMSIYIDGELEQGLAMVGGVIERRPAVTGPEVVTVPYELVSEAGPYAWGTPLADGGLPPPVDLAGIVDENNWLGRSQYRGDVGLGATLHEFRIYSAALGPELIAISALAGPDPVFLRKPVQSGQ